MVSEKGVKTAHGSLRGGFQSAVMLIRTKLHYYVSVSQLSIDTAIIRSKTSYRTSRLLDYWETPWLPQAHNRQVPGSSPGGATIPRTTQAGRSRKAPPALAHKAGWHVQGKSASFESCGQHRAAVFLRPQQVNSRQTQFNSSLIVF